MPESAVRTPDAAGQPAGHPLDAPAQGSRASLPPQERIRIATEVPTATSPAPSRRRLTGLVVAVVLVVAAAAAFLLWPDAADRRPGATEAELYLGYETGDFSEWSGVQAPPGREPTIVERPVRAGRYAARFELRPGDRTETGGYVSHRSEVFVGSNNVPFREGDDRWFGFSVRFGDGLGGHDGSQTVVQWKNDGTGSAPFDLRVDDDGRLCLADVRDWDAKVFHWCTEGPVETERWHDFQVHARFSSDPEKGFVELHYDQEPQELASSGTERAYFATLEPGADSYVKQGYYTGTEFSHGGVVYHDAMRIGNRLSDVVLPAD